MHLETRIVVTGGAGFLGSHLCERLLADGAIVICVDNFFTGARRNIDHLLDHHRFELIRHDVTFPLYIEVDQIYNLACPASPIHYQHDPLQTTKTSVHVAGNLKTYGPRMQPNDGRVASNFIVQALLGRDITVYVDGSQTRLFCYVDDLIDGLARLMATRAEVTGPVNIGNPTEFSMLELDTMVVDLTGSHFPFDHRPRPEADPRARPTEIACAQE